MNEQQLADLFAEQIDRLLLGEEVSVPAEAAELNELLALGQQLGQVQFQANAAAVASFEGQLATWLKGTGMPAAVPGIPKTLLMGLVAAGTVATLLAGGVWIARNWAQTTPPPTKQLTAPETPREPEQPVPVIEPAGPADVSQPETPEVLPKSTTSSQGETISQPKSSSQSDQLPVASPTIVETPTLTPTTPAAEVVNPVTGGESSGGDSNSNGSTSPSGEEPLPVGGDDDRGHGNDPGGFDPDNPGNSTGVGGPSLDRGGDSGSSSGSNSSNAGGNSGNSDKNNNKGKDKKGN